jgi:hypothetical protein
MVRAQMAEQMAARQKAALSVASAWGKVEKARERLSAAERDAKTVVVDAADSLPLSELAALSGVPVTELRRLTRSTKVNPGNDAGNRAADTAEQTAP